MPLHFGKYEDKILNIDLKKLENIPTVTVVVLSIVPIQLKMYLVHFNEQMILNLCYRPIFKKAKGDEKP